MLAKIHIALLANEIDTTVIGEPRQEMRSIESKMSPLTKEDAIKLVEKFYDTVDSL